VAAHGHDAWDPDWIDYGFTAWAECQHSACKQRYALAGKGSVGAEQDEDGDISWKDYFDLKFSFPVLRPIKVSKKCQEDVASELDQAFALYWNQPSASAGRLRVALELLLDHIGVPRRKRDGGGKLKDLSLHTRLENFSKSAPLVGPQLMALKALGNTGSHQGSVTKGDLLDALEVLEHALDEILEERSKRVLELSKRLTKKHTKKRR
jgi:hypothetical protein